MRITYRFWLFLLILTPLASKCDKGVQVTKFVSDNGQSYIELRDDRGPHKVYSKESDGSDLTLVLDKENVPEMVVLISDAGKAYVMEYRQERGVPPAGLRLIDASYMSHVSSRDGAFARWKSKFAVFKVSEARRSKTFKFPKPGWGPIPIRVDDNGITVAFPLNCEYLLQQTGAKCLQSSACICAFQNFCAAVDCYLRGDRQCVAERLAKLEQECGALGSFEQGEGADEGDVKDVGVSKVDGIYNLTY